MPNKEILKIRPYARLLTMLGDQLIKNERIALIELVKNSYDADATWVKVTFSNFGVNYEVNSNSKIIIEDSGHGMTEDSIRNHWLNPATPEKKRRKQQNLTTNSGRIIQGDKGIGRFAILKLGQNIKVITRPSGHNQEFIVNYNFSKYDDEFLTENGSEKDVHIDDLEVTLEERLPIEIIEKEIILGIKKTKRSPFGTIIEISGIKGIWSETKVNDFARDVLYMHSIFSPFLSDYKYSKEVTSINNNTNSVINDFQVYIYKDENILRYQEGYLESLRELLDNRAIIKVESGMFDSSSRTFSFSINDVDTRISIDDQTIYGQRILKDHLKELNVERNNWKVECGSFEFSFYIFDFGLDASIKYKLDKQDKAIINKHRVYLYRDGIRVYPYGDPKDDWLYIDMLRGTQSAGHYFSNNQLVGFVKISQEGNPGLIDKTNREGLIENGAAATDFIALLQTFLAYLKKEYFKKLTQQSNARKVQDIIKSNSIIKDFTDLKNALLENSSVKNIVSRMESAYKIEKQYLTKRIETTEELAGVGLSVEVASHDISAIMRKVFNQLDSIIKDLISASEVDKDELLNELQTIRGGISFIDSQLQDMKLLFKSTKQRTKNIKIKDIVEKVERLYKNVFKENAIILKTTSSGTPLIAKTTDAVLLQLLINLFDNSVYWLRDCSIDNKKIEILLDGNKGHMIFSDNGPGIPKDDQPYVFEAFYTLKAEDGRGLGLYIARQLLERCGYSIELSKKSESLLPGANFVVNFIKEED